MKKDKVGSKPWVYRQAQILRTHLRARGIPVEEGIVGLIRANANEAELLSAIDQSIIETQARRLEVLEFIANADLTLYPHQLRRILEWNPLTGHQKVSP